jgi:hypothetical protein
MKIKPEQILPLLLIIIDVLAAIVCFIQKDARRGIYWLAAAVLNVTVTF